MYDIVFYCDAGKSVGFGHLSRCIKVANKILKYKKLNLKFAGDFDLLVKDFLKKELDKSVKIDTTKKFSRSYISFVDRMFDYEDPNKVDKKFLDNISEVSYKTIVLTSGNKPPSISKTIKCIGYTPTITKKFKPNVYWGLKYAPTVDAEEITNVSINKEKVFLAFGGINNNIKFIKSVLCAINNIKKIKKIILLISPVNKLLNVKDIKLRKNLKLNIVHKKKNIYQQMRSAYFVVSSYGNLCYECLSLNKPLFIIAQKKFQKKYGLILEKKKYAMYLASIDDYDINDMSKKFEFFLESKYNTSTFKKIIPNGLKRISDILIKEFINIKNEDNK